jgi:hypothetical protein
VCTKLEVFTPFNERRRAAAVLRDRALQIRDGLQHGYRQPPLYRMIVEASVLSCYNATRLVSLHISD